MATLLLHLVGPMQSWGTTSRFVERDTGKEPSKSGVIGLLAAALGVDREQWGGSDVERLSQLTMGVRHDRSGVPGRDYQTAGCASTDSIIKADGTQAKEGVVSHRFYLADAAFLVGVEGADRAFLEKIHAALRDPVWPLALGRKSYVPSEAIYIPDGLQDRALRDILASWPWIGARKSVEEQPEQLLLSMDSPDGRGSLRMDQPLSSFAERRFGARFVQSEWIAFPKGVTDAAA